MAGTWGLLGQCLAMFIASFAVGYIPLGFKSALSGRPLKAISVFGMGLLVGAALTVIIPEGVTTLYTSIPTGPDSKETPSDAEPTTTIGISLLTGFALMMLVESLTPHGPHEESDSSSSNSSTPSTAPSPRLDPTPTQSGNNERDQDKDSDSATLLPRFADDAAAGISPDYPRSVRPYPGERLDSSTALFHGVAGTGKGDGKSRRSSKPKSFHTLSFSDGTPTETGTDADDDGEGVNGRPKLSSNRRRTSHYHSSHHISHPDHDPENRCQESEGGARGTGVAGLNATLGLVIHAMADGIALGASSLSESGNLGLVVFLAVIVHKGPTALGLTTTLLSLGLDPQAIRRRLLLFSASAPVGAILTYLLVMLFGGGGSGEVSGSAGKEATDGIGWWTGVVLLFSGGSFLYVATVISPLSPTSSHDREPGAEQEELSKTWRLSLLLGGMTLPLAMGLIAGGHEH